MNNEITMQFSEDDGHLYDVVAVNIETATVRIFCRDKSLPNAEAVIAMAVARRGLDEEFYVETPPGIYSDGDKWIGSSK